MIERLTVKTAAPVLIVSVGLLLIAMGALAATTFPVLNNEIMPSLRDNARVVGDSLRDEIEQALGLGIPLGNLVGVEAAFTDTREETPSVAGLALVDTDGQALYAAGLSTEDLGSAAATSPPSDQGWWPTRPLARLASSLGFNVVDKPVASRALALPVEHQGVRVATLHVAVDQLHVARELRGTAVDTIVVMGVAALIAFEVLFLVVSLSLGGPIAQFALLCGRIAKRDFTSCATTMGSPPIAGVLASVNGTVERVNIKAQRLRAHVDRLRARSEAASTEAADRLSDRLARTGRFAGVQVTEKIGSFQLVGARAGAFLFVAAEELARPFLPLYIRDTAGDAAGFGPAVLIAVPISAFMLTTALAGPFAAAWSDRVGRRRSFLLGAAVSTAGLAGTAFAQGFVDLVLWRALAGIGYALTFVACQGHVLDRTDERDRARGLSVFAGGIFAADICGPAVGGILAGQIGYSATLVVAAAVAAGAALVALRLMDDMPRPEAQRRSAAASLRVSGVCAANPRFTGTVILAAVPAKLLLTGFLFYLAPLILADLEANDSQIGRMLMLYGITALLLMPLFASLCDRLRAHGFMVGAGAIIAGAGLIPFAFGAELPIVATAIFALGLGQSMSISAQAAMITIVGREQIDRHGPGPVLGAFRLAERVGAAAGPLVAASAANTYGYVAAAAGFGVVAVALGTVFSALMLSIGTEPDDSDRLIDPAEAPG